MCSLTLTSWLSPRANNPPSDFGNSRHQAGLRLRARLISEATGWLPLTPWHPLILKSLPFLAEMGSEFSAQNENFPPHPPPPMASVIAVAQLYPCTSLHIQLLESSGLLHLFIYHRKKESEDNYTQQRLYLAVWPSKL